MLGLSHQIPMIMDSPQVSVYDFPTITYKQLPTELASYLNTITNDKYQKLVKELGKYAKELKEENKKLVTFSGSMLQRKKRLQIPRIIHQTVQDKAHIRPEYKKIMQELKDTNKNWEYRLYDNKDIINFIKSKYPHLLQTYLKINPKYGPAQADFFRYLVILYYGGVYLDSKSGTKYPFDKIIKPKDTFVFQIASEEWKQPEVNYFNGTEIQQWFIISTPNNPLIKAVVDQVIKNIHNPKMKNEKGKLGVLRITGPIMYTHTIAPLLKKVPHRRLFPDGNQDPLIYSKLSKECTRPTLPNHYSKNTENIIL